MILRELARLNSSDFVDWLAHEKSARRQTPCVTQYFQSVLRSYARFNWHEYSKQGVIDEVRTTLDNSQLEIPLTSVTIVTACMNRNTHLLRSIGSWLKVLAVNEIVIVDYASDELVADTLSRAGIYDSRVKIFRHEAESWHLAKAFNLGFGHSTGAYILKLDSDTIVNSAIPSSISLGKSQFKSGNWRTFKTNVLNGIFLARKDCLDQIGGYNQQIRRYGWDDCDLYERLSAIPLTKTDFNENDFTSIEHGNEERVNNGDQKAQKNDINTLIQGNRILANILPRWTSKLSKELEINNNCVSAENVGRYLDAIEEFSYRLAQIQNSFLYGALANEEYPSVLRKILEELEAGHYLANGGHHSRNEDKSCDNSHSRDQFARKILFTTLYEESNLLRRQEMIQCIRINIHYFDEVHVLYEDKSAVEPADYEKPVLDELLRLTSLNGSDKARATVAIVPIDRRPTYALFFEQIDGYQRNHPNASNWFAISNSDIYFDASIRLLDQVSAESKPIIWLSRWEPVIDKGLREANLTLYTDQNGLEWSLIQSSINPSLSIPNYLSADVWIFKDPPKDYQSFDYKLGTYFCDSFFANRAFLNREYVINPCLDIRCFHLHNPSHNSSATKFADKDHINLLYQLEQTRLGGQEPVAGVTWSSLFSISGKELTSNTTPYRWRQHSVLLNIHGSIGAIYAIILIDLSLMCSQEQNAAVNIVINSANYTTKELELIQDFCHWLNNERTRLIFMPAHLMNDVCGVADPVFLTAISESLQSRRIDPLVSAFKVEKTVNIDDLTDRVCLELGMLSSVLNMPCSVFLKNLGTEFGDRFITEMALSLGVRGLVTPEKAREESPFTLITSLFKAKKYIQGMLSNFEAILSLGACELIIIDANPDDEDQQLVKSCLSGTGIGNRVNYIRAVPDPGIYGCWMMGVRHAQFDFVSNFNCDDRRAPLHPHLLSRYLLEHHDCDVCFTGIRPINIPNVPWYRHLTGDSWFSWYRQDQQFLKSDFVNNLDGVLTSRNVAHCMPMWRKQLHDELGPFREDVYGTSADWAFWLECLSQNKRLILADPRPWGLYYVNPNSHNRTNDINGELENKIIMDYFGVQQKAHIQQ